MLNQKSLRLSTSCTLIIKGISDVILSIYNFNLNIIAKETAVMNDEIHPTGPMKRKTLALHHWPDLARLERQWIFTRQLHSYSRSLWAPDPSWNCVVWGPNTADIGVLRTLKKDGTCAYLQCGRYCGIPSMQKTYPFTPWPPLEIMALIFEGIV